MEDLIDFFDKGGLLMWPILACSLLAVAVFLERLIALRRSRILPSETFAGLAKHLEAGDTERAEHMCREQDTMVCRIVEAGLNHRSSGRDAAKEAMEETGQVEVSTLERGVGVLSTVAAVAPLLGLLGTVVGMMQVFQRIEDADRVDIKDFAGGIWEALIMTGAGLSVAIPTYIAFRFLELRIDRYGHQLEEAGLSLLGRMMGPAPAVDSPPSPEPADERGEAE